MTYDLFHFVLQLALLATFLLIALTEFSKWLLTRRIQKFLLSKESNLDISWENSAKIWMFEKTISQKEITGTSQKNSIQVLNILIVIANIEYLIFLLLFLLLIFTLLMRLIMS